MAMLKKYGWANFQQQYLDQQTKKDFSVGRVISIQGFKYYLITEKGETEAELSGKLLYSNSQDELPKVGDWVFYMDYDPTGYIIEVFQRVNALFRKTSGTKTEKQILASNIDYALIVQGLDRDFNLMRLERYLVQIAACGIKAIVILNKTDLVDRPEEFKAEIEKLQRDSPVYLCSTYTGYGLEAIKHEVLKPFKTYILIGSSGAGKSSLLNSFSDRSIQITQETSQSTQKGKHTTTARSLYRLSNDSLVIDTPGMREFGVTSEGGKDESELFPVIHELASQCRFADCKHIHEKGCAVTAAIINGTLDKHVYESYLKLLKEQNRFEVNAADKKRMDKQMGKIVREANNYRKKYKS
ncbi:MAG: ribosome small subunit-dependent GTPase A [Sporocytophaga sp.]|uniref:ribosome small subunit-dependent GTPase A n=1 Tax=Sporocytophaga sp. TaxID=2231183 RepID=UPI001B052494|nr:ribosome small subunit-dependent GTPase A [Sporocytophaga sp.]MBO9703603.1 ribosome small subunit-dependent GTPase A [Sporocytophaga sp.]